MAVKSIFSASILVMSNVLAASTGRTLTSWDWGTVTFQLNNDAETLSCKPACAWTSVANRARASGIAKVCNKDDQPLSNGGNAESSCSTRTGNNPAYLCSNYSPRPVADDFSYGFAITDGSENCCKCYQIRWADGPAQDKTMQIQVINEGGSVSDDTGRDFVLLMPGGGVGPNTKGCESQWGGSWGRQYGGVQQREDCENLPDSLLGGCYWRWNWAGGDINGWPIEYDQIECPNELSDTSGCRNS